MIRPGLLWADKSQSTRKTVILVFHSFGTWELQEKTTKHEELWIQNHIKLKVEENLIKAKALSE